MKQIKQHKKVKCRFGSYIIDSVLLFVFISFFIVELAGLFSDFSFGSTVVDVVLILLPTIITVVSIVLSLTKEEIYGVTLHKFNRLRGFWFYNFSHMVVCLISIFVFYTVSQLLGLKLVLIIIDIIAVLYSLYFSLQEIPVLLNDNKRIGKIIKNRYKNRDTSDLLGKQKDENILRTVLLHIIIEEGIGTAYKTLASKADKEYNATLLNNLLDIQNRYFWDANEDIEFIKSNISGSYKKIDILKAVDMGFSNIAELLEFKKDFDYKDIVASADETYQLTRSLFSLYRICESTGLKTKEKEKLNDVANRLFLYRFSKGNNRSKPYSFIALMSVSTLSEGKTWFLESLRDSDYASFSLFSFDEQPIGLFISILIAYIFKVFPSHSENLMKFINDPVKGLNGDGRSWKYHVSLSLEHANAQCITRLLPSLLEIYDSIQESYFENIFIKKNGVIQDYYGFSREYIFNAWLEIILFEFPFHFTANDVAKVIEKLSDNDKKRLAHYLPTRWIKNGSIINDAKLEFLSIFGDESIKVTENWHNKKIVNALSEFHNNYFKTELDKQIKETSHDYEQIKDILSAPFADVAKDSFYDADIDLSDEKSLAYSLRIDGFKIDGLIESYARSLKESLTYSIRKQIINIAESKNSIKIDENYNLTKESIQRIAKLSPDFMSKHNYLLYDEKNKSLASNIRVSDSDYLPSNFFGNEGCVSFKIELDREKTVVRPLTDDEIEHIIDKEYSMNNGLYKFSEMKNDEVRSVLVTKEELKKYVYNSVMFAQLVFKQKVILVDNQYLVVKKDNEDA